MLDPDLLCVMDRGYAEYQLFQDIIDKKSSFIGRIRENAVWQPIEERPLSEADRAAGVRRDLLVWLGSDKSGEVFIQPVRVIEVQVPNRTRGTQMLLLATDQMDLSAELVALGYQHRWSVEFSCPAP